MGIRVNDNTRSLSAQRQQAKNKLLINRSFQRLSSGLRINSAADDAAGLSISSRFESQFRGIGQAIRNAGDGISFAQTADSALGSVTDNLQRMRELSIRAANGTLNASDRDSIQQEIDQLRDEIDRIGGTTQFNGRNILDGSATGTRLQVGASANEFVDLPTVDARVDALGAAPQVQGGSVDASGLQATELAINGVDIRATQAGDDGLSTANASGSAIAVAAAINDATASTGVRARANATQVTGQAVAGGSLTSGAGIDNRLNINGQTIAGIEVQADDAGDVLVDAINAVRDETGVTAGRDASGALELTADDGRNIEISTTGDASSITGLSDGVFSGTVTLDGDDAFTVSGTRPQDAGLSAGTIGVSSTASIRSVDVTQQASANVSIEAIDRALEDVGRQRSAVGAVQNRLESTVNNLSNVAVNIRDSDSRVRDADFAKEASELLRSQILEQANIAVLSQANSLSRSNAIRLLGD
ncbi:MAG: flagellin [Myxococcota bacterium]|nr:flagellin [Myxococcota bacterium]